MTFWGAHAGSGSHCRHTWAGQLELEVNHQNNSRMCKYTVGCSDCAGGTDCMWTTSSCTHSIFSESCVNIYYMRMLMHWSLWSLDGFNLMIAQTMHSGLSCRHTLVWLEAANGGLPFKCLHAWLQLPTSQAASSTQQPCCVSYSRGAKGGSYI